MSRLNSDIVLNKEKKIVKAPSSHRDHMNSRLTVTLGPILYVAAARLNLFLLRGPMYPLLKPSWLPARQSPSAATHSKAEQMRRYRERIRLTNPELYLHHKLKQREAMRKLRARKKMENARLLESLLPAWEPPATASDVTVTSGSPGAKGTPVGRVTREPSPRQADDDQPAMKDFVAGSSASWSERSTP